MNTVEDPFASVRLKKSDTSPVSVNKEIKSADPFESVRMKKSQESEENIFSKILRGGTRTSSRIAETFAGIPGDISDIIQSGIFSGLEKAVGIEAPNEAREKMKGYRAPTSQELQELSEKSTKGYTKAKSEEERELDEFTKTVSSLLGPMKFRKALGLATIGTGISKGLQTLGFDEPIQDLGKFGTIFTLSMVNPKGVQNLYSGLYDKVKKSIPNKTLDVSSLDKRLESIQKHLQKGVSTSTKNAVLKPVEELRGKIKNGKIEADDLIQSRFDINELMGDPELLKKGKNSFPLVTRAVNKAIKKAPELSEKIKKDFTSADEAYSAFQESKKASRFIQKILPEKPLKSALLTAGIEAMTYPEAVLPTAAGIISGYGLTKSFEFLKRINANPTMRKYYIGLMTSAVNENKVNTLKYLHKLETEFEKKSSDNH